MPPVQLRLLPAPQPLVERLGAGFFRNAPHAPGVYRLLDAGGCVIYVGKAKDLSSRLASYRRTHTQSRKTVRLIHTARSIQWEVCESETAARLRENALIRTLRPRFNRVGTWPWSARFVAFEQTGHSFRLTVTPEPAGECYGAFRGGTQEALMALARLLWFAWHHTGEAEALPHRLVTSDRLRLLTSCDPDAHAWLADVRTFFEGTSDTLVARLIEAIPEAVSGFSRTFIAVQFDILLDFHRRGPVRNQQLRRFLPADRRTLTPEERDDLLVQLLP